MVTQSCIISICLCGAHEYVSGRSIVSDPLQVVEFFGIQVKRKGMRVNYQTYIAIVDILPVMDLYDTDYTKQVSCVFSMRHLRNMTRVALGKSLCREASRDCTHLYNHSPSSWLSNCTNVSLSLFVVIILIARASVHNRYVRWCL